MIFVIERDPQCPAASVAGKPPMAGFLDAVPSTASVLNQPTGVALEDSGDWLVVVSFFAGVTTTQPLEQLISALVFHRTGSTA